MMIILFTLLLIAVVLAWFGYRIKAIYCFAAMLILSVIWLGHHMTSTLNLSL